MSGTTRTECEKSPFVEKLLKKGYEVIYLIDPIDEYCVQNLPEFEGKKFQNAAKENLNLQDNDKVKDMNRPNQEILIPDWLITSHVT